MKKHYATDLLYRLPDGQQVDMYGWVKARRKHSTTIFLDVCDSTGFIQAVVERGNVGEEIFETAKKISPESAVKVTGCLASTGRPKPYARELRVHDVKVIGPATLNISPHPRSDLDIFDPRFTEQLLDKRHFYLRNEKIAAILRFRHVLTAIVHQWFHRNGFMEIHAPVLTPTPLYDDRTPIPVTVHGQNVYLTQCVGFYLEQAVHSFEKIYNMGPSFRAEESRSKRHLMEYWHIKAELAFVDFEDLAGIVEQFVHDITEQCMVEGSDLARTIGTEICRDGLNTPFPRIDYGEAVELLKAGGCDIEFGKSLGSEEESLLSKRFEGIPFWVVGIPRSIEPFPYVIDSTDPRRTKTADLIASRGFGELLGIAEKIHTLPMLDERLAEKGKTGDPRYNWLRELREYGCVPHGGFGMGMERLIRWLLGIPHVRDTIPFHRAFGRKSIRKNREENEMKRRLIRELATLSGQTVKFCGWVETLRSQKRMQFLIVRDHTGSVQVIHERATDPELTETINALTAESAVEITGQVVSNPAVKLGGREVVIESIMVVNRAEVPLPLGPTSGSETRLDWRFLDLRTPQNLLIFKIQTAAENAMRSFWKSEGFIEIHSPKFMGSASESGAELFEVKYFDRKAYLAQSPQFYKQMAMAAGFDRVFEIGPVFRANPSFTSRHDTEFISVDVEISWIESHEDVMQLEERWLRHILQAVKDEYGEEIRNVFGTDVVVPELPFPRVTMAEAYEILDRMGHQIERGEKGDLDPEGERLLFRHFSEKTGHEFVFVTEYPSVVRAFYHMRPDGQPHLTKSFDLLWKGLEVTTGAQREHRYDILVKQAMEKGLSLEPIQYYLNCFRYGCPPHGGYGFGLTRMLMVMLGLKNVREVTFLYRGVNRLTP